LWKTTSTGEHSKVFSSPFPVYGPSSHHLRHNESAIQYMWIPCTSFLFNSPFWTPRASASPLQISKPADLNRKVRARENAHKEESCQVAANDTHDVARRRVQEFKPWMEGRAPGHSDIWEEGLEMKISRKEWAKLTKDLNIFESDERFPKYSYNASMSTVIIELMPSPIHDAVVSHFMQGFTCAQDTASEAVQFSIRLATNEMYNDFDDRSCKIANLYLKVTDQTGIGQPKFVLEVGVSESYEQLVKDAKLWLEKILCPEEFVSRGDYGPIFFQGFKWVGEISDAYMEIWTRYATTGLARLNGSRINLFDDPTNLSRITFQLSDFMTIKPGDDRTIKFKWNKLQTQMQTVLKELAMSRYRNMIKDYHQRQGTVKDDDYHPSGEESQTSS
ncbi:hypothetical protein M432DRAFT_653532, partial [Thermoascus aurantiacus ATCC 26904]